VPTGAATVTLYAHISGVSMAVVGRFDDGFLSVNTRYFHHDHLSMRAATDKSGSVVASSGHFPFGESWYESGGTNKLKFTSYERDAESGNDYAMFRSYINRFGRFSSPDPIAGEAANPQSLNRYSYVSNDPLDYVDPLGLFFRPTCAGNPNLPGCPRPRTGAGGDGGSGGDGQGCDDGRTRAAPYLPPCPPGTGAGEGRVRGSLTDRLQKTLKDALAHLAQRCKDLLPTDKIASALQDTEFFDGTKPSGDGTVRLSDIVENSSTKRVFEATTPGDAAWVIGSHNRALTHNIVIGPAFRLLNTQQREATLVHEGTHMAWQRTDAQLWDFAQKNGAIPVSQSATASVNFQKWIEAGCPEKGTKP